MLNRCYGKVHQDKFPTYKGCTVCDEWLVFSNFMLWMENQDWVGKQLDKDILIQGNKIYGPDTCLFVPEKINYLFCSSAERKGEYPIGVSLFKRDGTFKAQCKLNGKQMHIGYYKTVSAAFDAYKQFKYKIISDIALDQKEPLKTDLLNYVII